MRRALCLLSLFFVTPVWAGNQLGEQPTYAREQGKDQQFTYVAAGNGAGSIQYQGSSAPGHLTSDATWQIRKFTYDISNNISTIQYANGTDEFSLIWDNRTTYTYSN